MRHIASMLLRTPCPGLLANLLGRAGHALADADGVALGAQDDAVEGIGDNHDGKVVAVNKAAGWSARQTPPSSTPKCTVEGRRVNSPRC